MSVVPGSLDTDKQPPMTVPLRHFLVGLGFLLAGGLAGAWSAAGRASGFASLAHVHLFLAGWVCVTIMGAMTQFVPVWSGVELHSRRLASVQLGLVGVGLVGFAGSLVGGLLAALPLFGAAMALGFWVFAYNVGRTLATLESPDVTERHFALALGFFVLLAGLGALLATDLVVPVFARLPVARADAVSAHVTLAVFGAVLTTVIGALYQLGTMFTQTELHGIDVPLRRFEEIGYPVGVVLLATARLVGLPGLGRIGGLLVVGGLASAGVILARRLHEARVPWTPMLSRYAVAAGATVLWAVLALPAWLAAPLATDARLGAPGTAHLLTLGAVGFVVLGTLYHVVPFIVWVHRYSDRLGYEAVPMVDDLYDDRLAAVDLALFFVGGGLLVVADLGRGWRMAAVGGGVLVVAGTLAFGFNLVAVVRRHSPHSLVGVLVPGLSRCGVGDEPARE